MQTDDQVRCLIVFVTARSPLTTSRRLAALTELLLRLPHRWVARGLLNSSVYHRAFSSSNLCDFSDTHWTCRYQIRDSYKSVTQCAHYREVILTQKLLPVMRVVCGEFFIFQQGSVPAHGARVTIRLL